MIREEVVGFVGSALDRDVDGIAESDLGLAHAQRDGVARDGTDVDVVDVPSTGVEALVALQHELEVHRGVATCLARGVALERVPGGGGEALARVVREQGRVPDPELQRIARATFHRRMVVELHPAL